KLGEEPTFSIRPPSFGGVGVSKHFEETRDTCTCPLSIPPASGSNHHCVAEEPGAFMRGSGLLAQPLRNPSGCTTILYPLHFCDSCEAPPLRSIGMKPCSLPTCRAGFHYFHRKRVTLIFFLPSMIKMNLKKCFVTSILASPVRWSRTGRPCAALPDGLPN